MYNFYIVRQVILQNELKLVTSYYISYFCYITMVISVIYENKSNILFKSESPFFKLFWLNTFIYK